MVQRADAFALVGLQQPFERLALPLPRVDGACLLGALVDAEQQATVQQLLVDVDRRRREHQHHRTLHRVLLGREVAGGFVLRRARDAQLAIGLQELQRIRRLAHAFFLGDG